MPKNPFGMRDGRIVTVGMLTQDERGLKCQCKCVLCGGDLVSRFCKERVDHFAHRAGACDETKAFIKGMSSYVGQILSDGVALDVPPVYAILRAPDDVEVTAVNIREYLELTTEASDYIWNMTIADGRPVVFDTVEIRAGTLLCTAKGHKLAIVIVPPDTICKSYTAKPYRDIATLVLTFTEEAFFRLIGRGGTLQDLLNDKVAKLYWILNPLIENSLSVILKQRQEWEEKREQKREKDKQKNLSAERRFNPILNRRYSLGRKEARSFFRIQHTMTSSMIASAYAG